MVSPQISPLTSLQPSPEPSGLKGNPDQRLNHILSERLVNPSALDTLTQKQFDYIKNLINKTVKETVTRATTGTQINTNKILRSFLPEESISGAISGPPPPPPGSSHSSDSILRGDQPPRGPPGSQPGSQPGSPMEKNKKTLRKLLTALINKPAGQINPVQLKAPEQYNGKDLSKFKPWWTKVKAYIETYPDNFDSSKKRISWVGSLFKDNALVWHQHRAKSIRDSALPDDSWKNYKNTLKTRFKDVAEPTRNLRKMRALSYKDNIAQYLTEFQDLNNVVRLGGQTIKKMVARAVPKKLIELVYSRHGTVPLNDLEFIAAIRDAGLTYKSLMLQLRHQRENPRERPGSRSEHSRSGQRQHH